jgi:thiol-disulfide isomerase/thioredoxin
MNAGNPYMAMIFDVDEKRGMIRATLAFPATSKEYRLVAFDKKQQRHLFQPGGMCSGGPPGDAVCMYQYYLDLKVLPTKDLAYIGIEVVTAEAKRLAALEAAAKAKERNIEILPATTFFQPYEFTLTDTEGKKVRSSDFKGKVLILDCWSSTCSVCMEKMPHLKEIYEKHHKDGLEIIGINFDNTREAMKKACAKNGIPWRQVWVPSDEPTRDAWTKVSDCSSLPRILCIDSKGLLRGPLNPLALETELERIMRK